MRRAITLLAAISCVAAAWPHLSTAAQPQTGDASATATPASAGGQPGGRVLRGVTIGPDGAPAPGVPIALHRVTETGGALVQDVITDEAGRFAITADDEADDALYFVAARYEGGLYIGPTFRPPFPEDSEYVVQVGVEETSAARMARGVSPDQVFVRPPASPWRWGIAFGVLVTLIVVGIILLLRMRGPEPRRRILISIAELDEDHAAGETASEEHDYLSRREELVERLRALG
jgi:hypothetical protein